MRTHQDLKDLLTLNRLSLTGAKAAHELLLGGLAPADLLKRIAEENFFNKKESLQELFGSFDAENEIHKASELGVSFLTVLDAAYPPMLRAISDPPLVLYVQGNILELDRAAAAVVGTRHPSFYGSAQAKKFSRGISEKGFTIVSGLARGIDQISHEAALEISHGRTLAVLGCGLDVDYPSGSRKLREKIAERGAVLTEYAFGTSPRAENFPRRNRIIAGLSLGVLVVEAHSRSGSLITAHLAADEGREVFAVPGAVDQLGSRGTHHLIKEGAQLVETAEEVVETLASLLPFQKNEDFQWMPSAQQTELSFEEKPAPEKTENLEDPEERVLALLKEESLSGDEILERIDFIPAEMNSTLTLLEIRGKVRRESNGRFALTALR